MQSAGKRKLIKLSYLDFVLNALGDVLISLGIVVTIRFRTVHSPQEIRDAMRYMLSIYPRLRSLVEPTLFSYKLRIFDDNDKQLEVLFNHAFRVKRNLLHNSGEYLQYRSELLNESFPLEQAIPIKIRYLPDDPMPVLLISIHHVACDGMSWIHMVGSLICYLNGKTPPFVPLDNPSVIPALLIRPFRKTCSPQ